MVSKRVMKGGDNKIVIRVGPLAEWILLPAGEFRKPVFSTGHALFLGMVV